ncbi:polysaccharide pyruvyl transferase family protein [Vallitalea guaymasensis]|uniref:polysaccharide pyruvyl transferase family protein n=1 Tax=Vallitalea guaymasensis TaxID=1185412 RepID=UPI0023542AD7|nr:polysaccharide pyruvyl transferase family protein [Vallitalea guaymasensis]
MKYANFSHNGKTMNSLGDQMQILAIDYIYQTMDIDKKDIIYIEKDDIGCYDGESVILPISFPLFEYYEGGINRLFSKKIKPVFLGHTLLKETLLPEEVEFYKKHEPIGCRDERMFDTLSKYGIYCYLMGCMTAVLPKRKLSSENSKVFVVDVNEDVIKYMPSELREKVEVCSHYTSQNKNIKRMAKERYERYINEASLIVTSLLHCSVPCIAAGIPTIIVKDQFSYRFAWLERITKIYLNGEFCKIDWNPDPIEYEEHKKRLLKLACDRINGISSEKNIEEIHNFYMKRRRRDYIVDAFSSIKHFIDTKWIDKDFPYKYAVWGLTQIAEVTVSYIKNNYPNACLMHVYDKYRKLKFEGITSQLPDYIKNNIDETVFVTAQPAKFEAQLLFNKIKKKRDTYVFSEILK